MNLNRPNVRRHFHRPLAWGLSVATLSSLPLVSCSGSTAGQPVEVRSSEFRVSGASIDPGSVVRLNQAITVRFTEDVDFSTISASTIRIEDRAGVPALGIWTQLDRRTVQFQPQCPTQAGALDAGFSPGREYDLIIGGATRPSPLNTAGDPIQDGLSVSFRTPSLSEPDQWLLDPVDGGPTVRILGDRGDRGTHASYVEVGGESGTVEFFRFDDVDQRGEVASVLPLNLYSDRAQQFSIVLAFDQPIATDADNVRSELIGLEYFHSPSGVWRVVPSTVALESHCVAGGSSVRVTPLGVLPQGASMRAFVRAGFRDLAGQRTLTAQASFGVFQTTVAQPTGQAGQRSTGSDEILEHFTLGGDLAGSLEDTSVPSSLPRAHWGNGTVSAASDFSGTGGPGANFDVIVRAGQTLFIDTAADTIVGGPGGVPVATQTIINGVIDLRDLTVEDGGRMVFVGPNTVTLLASGEVSIAGEVSVDGGDSFGVGTLNTTNQPEPGASGHAGGGAGGTGSYLTSASTPRGGTGAGAFNVPGLGGEGGETGYAPPGFCAKENRRGAGGGGGAFGSPVRYYVDEDATKALAICQMLTGMDGEPGFTGSPDGTGAVSQTEPARGGALGPRVFVDASPNNDFYGTMLRADGTQVAGELPTVWAGSGGGAGGDSVASATFPLTPFSITGDEKGSGGGGGAGGLAIYSLGDIVITETGQIHADGGSGGGGENTVFFDRVGGGSGAGSGGHIVLSSAASIIIEAELTSLSTGPFYRDLVTPLRHDKRPVRALGGQGGAGREDRCGASVNGESGWRFDAIPFEAFEGREDIPPYTPPNLSNTFSLCNEIASCAVGTVPEGTVIGGGGDGSPGLIQLHVADPDTQLSFGGAGATGYVTAGLDVSRSMVPPPVGWRTPTDRPDTLVPFFAGQSESFSRWIPLGLARVNADGSANPVEFFFRGTDVDGSVLRDGEEAAALAPAMPYTPLSVGGTAPSIQTSTALLRLPEASVADPNDLYRRNPTLLREFEVRFRSSGAPSDDRRYTVMAASFDAVAAEYTLALDPMGLALGADIAHLQSQPGDLEVELIPFDFRLLTSGERDRFPAGTEVRIKFDATVAQPQTGQPSPDPELSFSGRVDVAGMDLAVKNGYAEQIDALNGQVAAPGQTDILNLMLETVNWDFVRFKVEFEVPTTLGSELPGVDLLRIPFRF